MLRMLVGVVVVGLIGIGSARADDAGSAPEERGPWIELAIGTGVISVASIGYAFHQNRRIRDIERQQAELDEPVPFGDSFMGLCDAAREDGVAPQYVALCDKGEAAARRANIATLVSVGSAVATGAFIYLAITRKPKPAERGDIRAAPGGPGGPGVTVRVTF